MVPGPSYKSQVTPKKSSKRNSMSNFFQNHFSEGAYGIDKEQFKKS